MSSFLGYIHVPTVLLWVCSEGHANAVWWLNCWGQVFLIQHQISQQKYPARLSVTVAKLRFILIGLRKNDNGDNDMKSTMSLEES